MSYSSEVLADSPLVYWRLGEASGTTATDASGNGRNATYLNTPTLGVAGLVRSSTDKAMQVAADTGQCVSLASATWMNVSTLTVECLVKFTGAASADSNGDAVVGRYASTGFSWLLYRKAAASGGVLEVQVSGASGATWSLTSTFAPVVDQIYHVAFTYDGTTIRLYVDGVQVGSLGGLTGGVYVGTGSPIEVGRYSGAAATTPPAVIDEVAVYGTALTQTRVQAHYNASVGQSVPVGQATQISTAQPITGFTAPLLRPAVLADGPAFYLPMEETSGTTAVDASPNGRNATMTGGSFVAAPHAPTGRAWQQDGSTGQYGMIAFSTNYVGAVTLEAWVKPAASQPGALRTIIGKGTYYAQAQTDFPIKLSAGRSVSENRFVFSVDSGNDFTNDVDIVAPTDWVANRWYHVVGVFQNGTSRLYVDGVQVGSASTPFNLAAGASNWTIGTMTDYGGGVGTSRFAGQIAHAAVYPSALSAARVAAHTAAGNTRTVGKTTETDTAQPLTPAIAAPYAQVILSDAPWGFWRETETASPLVDSSGNGRNLAVTGAPTFGQPGPKNKAIDWPANTGVYARSAVGLGSPAQYSLEAWVYLPTLPTDRLVIFGIGDNPTGTGFNNAALAINAGGYPSMYQYAGGEQHYTSATPLTVGQWHHLVAVYANNDKHLMVNGVRVASGTGGVTALNNTVWLHAGHGATSQRVLIAEPAVYPTALSDARVLAHRDSLGAAFFITLGQATQTSEAMPLKRLEISQVVETDTAWQIHPPESSVAKRTLRQEITADGPAAYWRMDDLAASGTLADSSGNARNGSYFGTVVKEVATLTENPDSGTAVDHAGTGFAKIPYGAWMGSSSTFSASMVIKVPNLATGTTAFLLSRHHSAAAAFRVYLNNNGSITMDIYNGGFAGGTTAAGVIQSGKKHHVAITFSSPNYAVWVDGVQVLTGSRAQSTYNTPAMFLGGEFDSPGSMPMTQDEVAYFTYVLADARIKAHNSARFYQNTVAHQASETDTAQPLSLGIFQPVNQATETDTAATLRTSLLTVFETDTAQPITVLNPPDPFAQPWVIAGEAGVFVHDMTNSTTEIGEPLPAGVVKTAWFQWTAPDTRAGLPTRFHTRGSSGDTTLRVYTGDTFGALVQIATSDDAYGDDADLRFNVVSGTTYHIQLGLKSGDPSSISLTWFNADPEEYDSFSTPLILESDYGADEFSLNNGTTEVGEPVPVGTVASSWLQWDSDTDQAITFNFRSFQVEPYTVRVYYGSTLGALTQVVEQTGTGSVSVTIDPPVIGRTYFIQISSGSDLSPGFEVAWSVQAAPVEPWPLPVPSAEDPIPKVPLHAFLYESDGMTMVTEIPRRMGVSLQEPLNIVGIGALSISLNDEVMNVDEDVLRWGRVVKFFLGWECIHGFEIKERVTSFVNSEEFKGFIVTVGGPSVHYELEKFIVRHDGKPRPDSSDSRFYSWASKPGEWYNASDWNDVVNQNSLTNPPSSKKAKKPKNWKVREAKWIWSPGPYKYFRKTITIKEDGTLVRIFAAADEWYRVYCDGEEILDDRNNEIGYTKHKKTDIVLAKGNHTFSAIVRGIHTANIGDGNDSFLFAMCKLDLDGKIIRPALLVSDNTWECHVGNPPPGWNRAQVLRNVVKEAKDRGIEAAQRLTFGFDGDVDSEGKPWPKVQFNQEVFIGTSGLNLQAQLSEGNGFDVWVDPADFKLHAWRRRGKNRSASVTLEPGRNLLDWEIREKDEALNKWLIQYDGGWTEYDAKGSQEDLEIRESYVSFGAVKDEKSAKNLMKRVAQGIARAQSKAGTSDLRKRPYGQPEGGLIGVAGAYPFLDFGVGDVVLGPNRKGKMKPVRVLMLTLNEDQDGNLSFDPQLEEVE